MRPIPQFLLCGAGNIGSFLAPLVARIPNVSRIGIVDPDTVDPSNTAAQAFGPQDIGQFKAVAVARHLASLRADLTVDAFPCDLEDLPRGWFSGVVACCLDNNGGRRAAAERTWQSGGSLIDAGVNGLLGLARVTVIRGPSRGACLQCAWSAEQYAQLGVRHLCRRAITPTNAPAALGSFTASLAATQIHKPARDDTNFEIVASPQHGEMWVSTLPESPDCRFPHPTPTIECLPRFDFTLPVGDLFERLDTRSLAVPDFAFAGRARCPNGCRAPADDLLWLARGRTPRACPQCGRPLAAMPFHDRPAIRAEDFPAPELARNMLDAGLLPGDIVVTDNNRWIQLGSPCRSNISLTDLPS